MRAPRVRASTAAIGTTTCAARSETPKREEPGHATVLAIHHDDEADPLVSHPTRDGSEPLVGRDREGGTHRLGDVRSLLDARSVDVTHVEFLHEIGPNGIDFVGFDEPRNQVVRGVVSLKVRLAEGKLVASAEIELLCDGEIPF